MFNIDDIEEHVVHHQCGWCGEVTVHRCAKQRCFYCNSVLTVLERNICGNCLSAIEENNIKMMEA